MAVCLDVGPGSVPYAVSVVASDVGSVGACNVACPVGNLCVAVGSGELVPPDIDPAAFTDAMGVGFGVAAVPLAVVFGILAVFRVLRAR